MSGWQPIETAPAHTTVLVCDEQLGRPWTIAKAYFGCGRWRYVGGGPNDQIDFEPTYWIAKDVEANPFHLPLSAPPVEG